MNKQAGVGDLADYAYVSTGHLPPAAEIVRLVDEAHARYKSNIDGTNSQVYPALARVPSELFGICVVGTKGEVHSAGAAEHEFSIMSVSKPFVFALVCQAHRRGAGASETRRECDRPSIQLACCGRMERRRKNEPHGERGRDRSHQPHAWRDRRREMEAHP